MTPTARLRARRREVARRPKWDGRALIFDPAAGHEIDADDYKKHACEPAMAVMDTLPREFREIIHGYDNLEVVRDFKREGRPADWARDEFRSYFGWDPI